MEKTVMRTVKTTIGVAHMTGEVQILFHKFDVVKMTRRTKKKKQLMHNIDITFETCINNLGTTICEYLVFRRNRSYKSE